MLARLRSARVLPWLSLALPFAGCGGNTSTEAPTGSAGQGGSAHGGSAQGGATVGAGHGGASAGATSGAGGMGAACDIPTSTAGPYAITFHLHNAGAVPVYLWQGCELTHSIAACSSGYTDPLITSAGCSVACGDGTAGGIECGACQSMALTVEPGGVTDLVWTGLTYTFDAQTGCHVEHVALPGSYRLSVSVWDTRPVDTFPMPVADRVVHQPFALALPSVSATVELAK